MQRGGGGDKLWAIQHKYAPYLFVSPFVILFCVFLIYPLGRSIVLSMYKTSGPNNMKFVGLENYRFLISDLLFWRAAANTMGYAILLLSLSIPGSLALALLMNRKDLRMRNFFRFAFFAPYLVGNVFVAVIFGLLLAERNGLVNQMIGFVLPFIGTEINWLGKPELVLPALVMASLWLGLGYGMVYFLAALQSVDRELYEAAEVDGAGKWKQFLHVTLPGIRPVLIFMVLVGTIGAFQLFELPWVLLQGPGPNYAGLTIVMYLFQIGFQTGDIGMASAIGWMLVFFILILAVFQLWLTRAAEDR
jgi:ABC-type sugar transport system permease subunit